MPPESAVHKFGHADQLTLVLHGMAMSMNLTGESVLQNPTTGMFTYEAEATTATNRVSGKGAVREREGSG